MRPVDELLRTFRNFLFRDFFYVVCGALIFRAVREVGPLSVHPIFGQGTLDTIVLVGMAYAIGYLNQEVWSQFGFVSTAPCSTFGAIPKPFYKRHTRRDWVPVGDSPDFTRRQELKSMEGYQRITNHRYVGVSMGSALLTVSLLLTAAAIVHGSAAKLNLLLITVPLATAFLILSWVKAMQQCEFLHIGR